MRWRQSEGGYILPATIILGLAISIASATFLQYTASTSDSLNGQSYTIYAQEAAKAGIAYANSCVRTGNASWSVPLTPDLSCDQATTNGSHYVTVSSLGDWRSTFSVSSPSTASSFGSSEYSTVSTGIVELLQNGSVTKRIYATKIVDFQKTTAVRKPSTGLSLTAIRGDTQMCSIANGKLYCWGSNSYGQIGDGTTTDRTTPTLVNGHGAITANMIVSEVSTSNRNTCAIADGQGYCWGENSHGQIGDTTNVQKTVPTAIAGPLAGKKITDLTIGAQNLPYIADEADEHACAIYNGVAYCWGSNGYTQLTDSGGCSGSCYTSTPVAVYGYNSPTNTDSPLYGKKMSRLASSSHDTCSVTQGHVYCWGVEAPVPPLCTVYFYYFEPNPGSLCDGVYGDFVNYYDVHATAAFTGAASDLNNRIVDPASFQMSTDLM
ncbi:MAG: chromosome condensation regulator, partial [Candidatus Saccharibacteria bacterium]|nr:chromosome condensation regulator [Candidatus Saccharibacteria bacterium]